MKVPYSHDLNSTPAEFKPPTLCSEVESPNPLQNQAYLYLLKILSPKNENFQIKIWIFFHISAQNMDCEYSLEPPW